VGEKVRHSSQLAAHRTDDEANSADMPFDFTEENYKIVKTILAKYPKNYKQSGIIPLLDLAQRQCGNFVPLAAMNKVAEVCGVPPVRVYEVASFYTMFNRERVGKYFIQLCGTTPCMVNGSEEIKAAICKHLGVADGETTKDGLFTLKEVECLGACANAPMIQVNDDFYECLTPETTIQVLEAYKAGKPIPMAKWGSKPMNGQISCEGPLGKTSLKTVPEPAKVRELKAKVDPASVKKHMMY
jgi:NADH dehydrogenase (ubiquinone) flavoprotein 2